MFGGSRFSYNGFSYLKNLPLPPPPRSLSTTDLPSFVSGDLLVCFDPHAAFLPGVNPAQPGIKIRFPSSPLLEHFPDSFAPFRGVFGCDMATAYDGTLFRFPLRTPDLAASSDIKPRPYSPDDVLGLFRGFKEEAAHALLYFFINAFARR